MVHIPHTSTSNARDLDLFITTLAVREIKKSSLIDADGCGGVYCTEDIAEDEVFFLIPCEPLVLTDALVRQHLPRSTANLDCRTALMLYLIQQRARGEASFFQPYLDMIPERIYTALEFDDDDLEHLRGTNAFLTVIERKKELRDKYEKTMLLTSDEELEGELYTWEMFLWAETVVSSRAYPAHLFGESMEGEVVLIPLAGMVVVLKEESTEEGALKLQGVELTRSVG